jgi:hypothetical protein
MTAAMQVASTDTADTAKVTDTSDSLPCPASSIAPTPNTTICTIAVISTGYRGVRMREGISPL